MNGTHTPESKGPMEDLSGIMVKVVTDALAAYSKQVSVKFNLPYEDVIQVWNSTSTAKIPAGVVAGTPAVSFVAGAAEVKAGGCCFAITRGDRKGLPCGKKVVENTTLCSAHSKGAVAAPVVAAPGAVVTAPSKEVAGTKRTCQFEITRGDRKGQLCNKTCAKDNPNFCSSHKARGVPSAVVPEHSEEEAAAFVEFQTDEALDQ